MDTQKINNLTAIPADINLPAGFWIRLGAFTIDMLCIWLLSIFIYSIFFAPRIDEVYREMFPLHVMLFVGLIYHTLTIGKWGKGLGKLLAGIMVTAKDGGKIGYIRSFARVLACWLSALPLFFGYLTVVYSKDKISLHDYLAGTRVVYKKPIGLFYKTAIILSGIFLLLIGSWSFYGDMFGYRGHSEKERAEGALSCISIIKSAQEKYYTKHNAYADEFTKLDTNDWFSDSAVTATEIRVGDFIVTMSTSGCGEKPCYTLTATRYIKNAQVAKRYGVYSVYVIVPNRPGVQILNCPGGSSNCDKLIDQR